MSTLSVRSCMDLFAKGAMSAFGQAGYSEKHASSLVVDAYKEAASRRGRFDDEDEDEGGTWWSRNKHWALPAAIGTGAFLIGGDAGRNGRADRGYISNALNLLVERVRALFGDPDAASWRSMTEVDKNKLGDDGEHGNC